MFKPVSINENTSLSEFIKIVVKLLNEILLRLYKLEKGG